MKNKYKAFFEIMLVALAFAVIWVTGILIYGEYIMADTLNFASLLGEKWEKLFVITPAILLIVGFILTNISVKKDARHIFIATEILLLLPFIGWGLGNALFSISEGLFAGTPILSIPGLLMILLASPALTWLSLVAELFDGCGYVIFGGAYIIISLLNIVYYKIKIKKVS